MARSGAGAARGRRVVRGFAAVAAIATATATGTILAAPSAVAAIATATATATGTILAAPSSGAASHPTATTAVVTHTTDLQPTRPRILLRPGDVAVVDDRLARAPYSTLLQRMDAQVQQAPPPSAADQASCGLSVNIAREEAKARAAKDLSFMYAVDRVWDATSCTVVVPTERAAPGRRRPRTRLPRRHVHDEPDPRRSRPRHQHVERADPDGDRVRHARGRRVTRSARREAVIVGNLRIVDRAVLRRLPAVPAVPHEQPPRQGRGDDRHRRDRARGRARHRRDPARHLARLRDDERAAGGALHRGLGRRNLR